MNRREFVQCSIGMACLWPTLDRSSEAAPGVRLLPAAIGDLAGKESEYGFAKAVARLRPVLPLLGCHVIVPSASALKGTDLSSMVLAAERGATVLIDLADGFAAPQELVRTRASLKHYFAIEVANPIEYATGDYIVYRWPHRGLVRHFTRVSYIPPGECRLVAHLGINAVGAHRALGLGCVVVLGSSLGSLLLAEDEQAHQILAALLSPSKLRYGTS